MDSRKLLFGIRIGLLLSFAIPIRAGEPLTKSAGFRFAVVNDKSLGLYENDKPVFIYNHGQIGRPETPGQKPRGCYFHPVHGVDGEVLTDDFPRDHLYHRGIYWAWPHIEIAGREYDLWSARGELQQRHVRWLMREADSGGARIGIENGWFVGDKQLVREEVRVHVHPTSSDARSIDVDLQWSSLDHPMTLWGAEGKSYGGFNFRFAPRSKTVITVPENSPLSADVIAPAGKISGDLVVTKLPWADFVGDFQPDGNLSGAAVFVHPQHPDYPPTWMARHYGLVSVGWPGVKKKTFPANERISCRYRLWVHRGERSSMEIQKAYDAYRESAR